MIRRYAFALLSLAFLGLASINPSWADQRRVEYNIARDAIEGAISFECAGDECYSLVAELTNRLRPISKIATEADKALDALHRECFDNLSHCQNKETFKSRIRELNTRAVELRTRWVEKFKTDVLNWDALNGRQMDLSFSFTSGTEARDICGTRTAPVGRCINSWPDIQTKYRGSQEMVAFITYRRRLTDGLIAQASLEVLEDDPSIKGLPFWQVEPSGSYSYTSDLDVTIVGLDAAMAVEEFNTAFRRHFGKESGILLDSNVYADPFTPTEREDPRVQETMHYPDGDPSKQDSLALVKLRRYMTAAEWKEFRQKMASMASPAKEEHGKRLERAEALYNGYVDALYDEILARKERSPPTSLSLSQKEQFLHECEEGAKDCSKNDHMYASNVLYARNLTTFRSALRHLIAISPQGRSHTQYDAVKEALGIANIFANEAYIAQGPHLHILGLIQAPDGPQKDKIRDNLTHDQILASINEQLGDALKDIDHYERNFGKAVYKCAKYLDRLRHGLGLIRENVERQGSPPEKRSLVRNVENTLEEINRLPIDKLLAIRKGAWKPPGQAKDATDAQKETEAERSVRAVAGNVKAFNSWIVSLAKEVNFGVRQFSVLTKERKADYKAIECSEIGVSNRESMAASFVCREAVGDSSQR